MTRLTRAANDFNNAHTINLRRARARVRAPFVRDENFAASNVRHLETMLEIVPLRYGAAARMSARSPRLMAVEEQRAFSAL